MKKKEAEMDSSVLLNFVNYTLGVRTLYPFQYSCLFFLLDCFVRFSPSHASRFEQPAYSNIDIFSPLLSSLSVSLFFPIALPQTLNWCSSILFTYRIC